MSYTYKGTKITGTSTSGKVFKNSGISNAKKGQTYFNKSTGHVYKCTDDGKAKNAKWKYLKTDIASKPSVAVSGLGAPVRVEGTRKMKATWKTPAAMIDAKKGDRATALSINWYLGIAGKDPKKVVKTSNEKLTESTINLNNFEVGSKKYERKEFYPFPNKPKLNYVTVSVVSRNDKGAGALAKATREFNVPRKPSISDFSFDSETGEVSCTIDTDAGGDYYERYDTRYKMTVYYSNTKETSTIYDTSTTDTSKTITFDDASYASRNYEDYAKVTVQAWARGYKGDSCKPEENQKTFYVAYPAQASIDDVQVSSKDSTGKCTIYVNTHSTTEHPVDRVKLEYLANCTYAEANLIPGDASWEQTEILDNATCKALAMSVSNLIPDRGKYTWIRLKTFHANETVLYRYSQYWRVRDLETPAATAADDKIKILSAIAGADGRSAVIDLVWDDGELPSTGTELSWDKEEDAWKSTKDPNDYDFTWSDGPRTVGSDTWGGSATITIKELDEASKYFVKARRYSEGDETTYSEYSNSATVVTSEKPESVTATADRYVPKGSGLNVYWTFAGNGLQREWQIVDSNGTILANGEGSLGSTQIPADRLIAFAEDGDIEFTVQVSTGSGFVVSESKKVTIIEPPTLEITGNSLVHAHEEAERNFSGEIVTFEPREDEFVKSLKVPLEPLQNLHGYDKPWVGGAGKQLLPNRASYSYNGITYTRNVDGSVTVNGTATALSAYNLFQTSDVANLTPSETYHMRLVGYEGTDIRMQAYSNNSWVAETYGTDKSFTIPSDSTTNYVRLRVIEGTTIDNVTVYPMVSKTEITEYEPYENICPITGFTGCEVDVVGFNQWDEEWENKKGYSTGTMLDSSSNIASKNFIPVISGTNYYLKLPSGVLVYLYGYDADRNYIGLLTLSNGVFNTETAVYIKFATRNDTIATYNNDICINLSDASLNGTYKPYNPNSAVYPVSWQDEAGAVYGGTINLVTGVLTVDRAMVSVTTVAAGSTVTAGKSRWSTPSISNIDALGILLSDKYEQVTNAQTYSNIQGVSVHPTNGKLYIYDEQLATMSTAEVNAYLASNPIQVVYELATPQTYQLDPVQVALLIGEQNNIWNDVDITELKLAEVILDEDQLQTNDLMLSFKSNKICDIKLIVTSQGAVGQFPQGILRQTAGDTIHSNVYVPVWTESNGEFITTVHLPLALDFWDKGSYTLRAVAIDRQTGLKSSKVGLEFSVAWAHQAPSIEPLETYTLSTDTTVSDDKNYYEYDSETETYTVVEPVGTENPHNEGWYEVTVTNYVTLTPIDEIDDNGFHHQAVQINLTPPPNADADDVYDIYRMTGDGAQLIGQSFPQTYTATDEYAPFGEDLTNHYRIAVRTADGDVEFSDIEYVLEGEGIRLDWAEGFIEYPYSIGIGDSYKKDVDIRKHLDGSIGAYWNHGVERSGSLSTDAIKILQQDDIDLTRRLGRYTGPVFVRTREGTAFEADVQISNLSSKNIAVMSIAIDATEVDLTEEFMLPTPFNLDEGEQ